MTEKTTKKLQQWRGTVVTDTADKTITVAVDRFVMHPKYRKQYTVTKKYLVHDPENQYHVGDLVTFRVCRPISKRKRFVVADAQ